MPIPDLPGNLLPAASDQCRFLKSLVSRLCHIDWDRFPGSQPVSFTTKDLTKLESEDFWVAEKSDGVRVLLFVYTDVSTRDQSVYLIDRHNSYRQLDGFFFPFHENPQFPMRNTLVDGELVIDFDPVTTKQTLRFLAFDCLLVEDQNIMSRPLDKRYGRLTEWFFKPYARMLKEFPEMTTMQPFEIKVKDINFSYHAEKVFNFDIPALQHGNDGLIYTCVNTPYVVGATDSNILKWKPPSENSIDFKLVLRFPAVPQRPNDADFYAKPFFGLHTWLEGTGSNAKFELYDQLYVTDEEWDEMKQSGEQYDDRIVEVHWDPERSHWRLMRFRDDKPKPNHCSVVEKIIESIADGVEKEELLAHSNDIRNAWKSRHSGAPGAHTSQPQVQGPSSTANHPHLSLAGLRRYGPIASSPWSKVAGPEIIGGMKR